MNDDRNEGECYGPFHAGFICKDCADCIRALEAQCEKQTARAEKAEARVKELEVKLSKWTTIAPFPESWQKESEAREKAAAALEAAREERDIAVIALEHCQSERAAGRESGGQKR